MSANVHICHSLSSFCATHTEIANCHQKVIFGGNLLFLSFHSCPDKLTFRLHPAKHIQKKETHRHLHEVKSIRFFFANISQSNAMTNVKNNLFQSETHV